MGWFSNQLIELRKENGFKSALSFYEYLAERDGVVVNYAQYKKIELGKTSAQPDFVRRISKVFPPQADQLIKAYCADLFPEQESLFKLSQIQVPKIQSSSPLLLKQEELTEAQVMLIGQSQVHYGFYMLITIARTPLSMDEIKAVLGAKWTLQILKEFLQGKLIIEVDGKYQARSTERVFPPETSPGLKKVYAQLDQWDLSLASVFKMNRLENRSIIRRVSPRYVPILVKSVDLLLDQLRASDETDESRNEEVVSLFVELRHGRLPG